jgi:hypothetical protein
VWETPVDSKVLTPKGKLRGGQKGDVDSKRMTPKQREDVDESKSEGRAVTADAAEVYGEGEKGAGSVAG